MDIGSISSLGKSSGWVEQASTNAVAAPALAKVPVVTASAVQQPDAATAQSQLGQALQSINKTLQALSQNLEFTVDADSNRTIVKVMDTQTQEIIRQMPTAEALEISKALDKLQGLLLKQKA